MGALDRRLGRGPEEKYVPKIGHKNLPPRLRTESGRTSGDPPAAAQSAGKQRILYIEWCSSSGIYCSKKWILMEKSRHWPKKRRGTEGRGGARRYTLAASEGWSEEGGAPPVPSPADLERRVWWVIKGPANKLGRTAGVGAEPGPTRPVKGASGRKSDRRRASSAACRGGFRRRRVPDRPA